MRKLLIILTVLTVAVSAGCARNKKQDEYRTPALSKLPFVYRMTVQQGNIISEEMIDQVELGMSKAQVRYVLGTPLLTDMFHANRWDYTYTIKRGHAPMETKRLTLWFQDDQLVSIEGDLRPSPQRAAATAEDGRELVVEVPDWRDNRGLINRTLNAIRAEPNE
jgi:outer membrane protein assembly factor BamE